MRSRPHIYSDSEVASIIAAAKALPSICGLRGLTCSTLFALIAVTGLRVSEALALDGNDLDADNGVLRVRQGKNGKERLLPLDPSTVERLLDYRIERDRLIGHPAMPLFVTDKATRLTDCTARYNFAQVCQQIGLRPEQQYHRHGRGPRIHDLRHNFAVRTMIDWYRTGKDPAREMIRLTTYLGHSSPSGTYWYLEAVPELLDLAVARATANGGGGDRPRVRGVGESQPGARHKKITRSDAIAIQKTGTISPPSHFFSVALALSRPHAGIQSQSALKSS